MRQVRRLWYRLTQRKPEPLEFVPEPLPPGTYVWPVTAKREYEAVPYHVYHPTPYDKITVLRHRGRPHEWLVAGWYVRPLTEGRRVTGQVYRPVTGDRDKEVVLAQVKTQDREADIRFAPT
jgi:hypothetical protein